LAPSQDQVALVLTKLLQGLATGRSMKISLLSKTSSPVVETKKLVSDSAMKATLLTKECKIEDNSSSTKTLNSFFGFN